MPITSHLLERAYQLINAHQIQNAELVLDAVVRVDPQNIEAWIAYLQIHQNRSDLEWLRDRILRTRELDDQVKKELLLYQNALMQNLTEVEAGTAKADTHQVFNFRALDENSRSNEKVSFELLDVFNYPAAMIEPSIRRKPRRKNFLESSFSSPASQALALLFTFFAAVRLITFGYFLGYLLLGLFLVGCFYWLSNHKSHNTLNTMDTAARMYFLDTKNKLALTDKATGSTKSKKTKGKNPQNP